MHLLSRLSQLEPPSPWLLYPALGCLALYVYGSWPYGYWKRRGVPGPKMLPLVGDLITFVRLGFRGQMQRYVKEFGKVYGTFMLRRPVLVIADAEMVKQVCVKRADSFINRGSVGNETKPFDKGILALKDQEWKRVRSILTPSFSSGKIKAMFPLVEQCSNQLCSSLLKTNAQPVEIKTYFMNFTMDVVASTLFGLRINTQDNPDNEFKRNADQLFKFNLWSWKFWVLFLFPGIAAPLFKRFNVTLFPKECLEFFVNIISNALREREASEDSDKYQDFLASMVVARREAEHQGARGLTEHEVLAQSLTFMLAGFETTANAMHFLAYFLALNPECQERAHREILEVSRRHGSLTYQSLKDLEYLNNCFDEALRMCPPAVVVDRICNETTSISGYQIEKGTGVLIPIYLLAHDPDIWVEPEKFNPDRFRDESEGSRERAHLIPFGLGPRNCIGMRLAQLEVRKAMAEALLKVEFKVTDATVPYEELEFNVTGLLTPKKPIQLLAVPRK